jgi:hypothetical protein
MAPIRDRQIQVRYEDEGSIKPSPWLRWFMMGVIMVNIYSE